MIKSRVFATTEALQRPTEYGERDQQPDGDCGDWFHITHLFQGHSIPPWQDAWIIRSGNDGRKD